MKFIYTKKFIKGAEIKELIDFLSTNDNVKNLNNYPDKSAAYSQSRPRPRPKSRPISRYPNIQDYTVEAQYIPDEGGYSAKSIRRRYKSRRHKKTNRRHKKSNNRHKKSNRRR